MAAEPLTWVVAGLAAATVLTFIGGIANLIRLTRKRAKELNDGR